MTTKPLHLIGQSDHDDRQRILHAVRAAKIDGLVPNHKEAALAAERYLDGASEYGKATDAKLRRWRAGLPGITWMSSLWVKGQR